MIHGRPTKKSSHWWYVAEPLVQSKKYESPDGICIAELRSNGLQTVVPPSVHPSGEPLSWERDGEPARIEGPDLQRQIAKLSAGSLLARHWPKKGSRNDCSLALHGLLLRARWSVADCEHFVRAVAEAAGDEEFAVRGVGARTTAERLGANGPATGAPRLKGFFGPDVVERVREWLQLNTDDETGGSTFKLTDMGNANRFARSHRDRVRFCHTMNTWFVWDGRRWIRDDVGTVQRLGKATVRQILDEARLESDDEKRKKIVTWQMQSESEGRIRSQLELARSEDGIPVRAEELDGDRMLFNCYNGTLDLTTGRLREHRRSDLITKLSPVSYSPTAECPIWSKFLDRISRSNLELQKHLQRIAGYSLTGQTNEHALFLLHGGGANGKTTFLEVLKFIWGDYAMTADFSSFVSRKETNARNDLARLAGARLVTAVESRIDRQLDEELIKQITGGDKIATRFLYREHFEYQPEFKLLLATNHKPRITGTDQAIWRRIRLVPFTVSIPCHEQDRNLPEKLRSEASGILAWAVKGLSDWLRVGLSTPQAVTEATQDYRSEQDILQHFIEDECVLEADAETSSGELHKAYRVWCQSQGESSGVSAHFRCSARRSRLKKNTHPQRQEMGGDQAHTHKWTR